MQAIRAFVAVTIFSMCNASASLAQTTLEHRAPSFAEHSGTATLKAVIEPDGSIKYYYAADRELVKMTLIGPALAAARAKLADELFNEAVNLACKDGVRPKDISVTAQMAVVTVQLTWDVADLCKVRKP